MALEYKRNAIIVCHEANDIKTSMEKKMKSATPADDDANDSERENVEEDEEQRKDEHSASFEYGLQN